VSDTFEQILNTSVAPLAPGELVEIIKTNDGYKIAISQSYVNAHGPFSLYISDMLYELFKFPVVKATDKLFEIKFNTQPEVYGTQNILSSYTRYIPDTWFPFDIMVIKTNLAVEREKIYNNQQYQSKDSEDIMLSYKMVNDNPDGIYNFFDSDIDPNSGWITFGGVSTTDNINFWIQLRLKYTLEYVDYTILKTEKAYFVLEHIETA
jgi:hypothetical protein